MDIFVPSTPEPLAAHLSVLLEMGFFWA